MTTSSAPGKIILFGEHAVVYGRPALAVPVSEVQATATVSEGTRPGVWISAADISLEAELGDLAAGHPLRSVIRGVFARLGIPSNPSISLQIHSTIPVASGLGSGAAVSVAIIRALSSFLGKTLPDEEVSALAYETEKLHHGTPSGIDNSVITFAEPVYFTKGKPIELLRVGTPFWLVIGDTGVVAPTKESVGDVRRLWEADTTSLEGVFDKIGRIAEQAKGRMERGEWRGLGELMNSNHALLRELSVSSNELERLVEAGLGCGALGAKLSGGGRGGNMMALVEKENAPAVAEALKSAGARRTIITQVG
jgi:mevalonate kinase